MNSRHILKNGESLVMEIEGRIHEIKVLEEQLKRVHEHNHAAKTSVKENKIETNPKDLIGMTKPSISLFPPSALIHGSLVMKNGLDKYGLYNWRGKSVQSMVYIDAALRHIISYLDGEEEASDSGLSHIAHAMMCCAILIDAKENDCLIDNRPSKGNASELIDKYTVHKKEE